MSSEMINGARILLECLHRVGVTDIFGYPGGAVIPIYDEIYSFDKIKHYFARHEQGAVHAADGYARVSGKVGVCLATSGPGATNLVTGIMTAHMDSIPLLAITGQVRSNLLGRDAFQETDIVGITVPITKVNYLVQSIKDIPKIIKEAYFIASTGRPGPVLVDIPNDIQQQEISYEEFNRLFDKEVKLEGYDPTYVGHPVQIKRALSLIKKAKKPLIIAGAGGAAHLPGMLAAVSPLPVIGVPIKSRNSIDGWDSVLSILQMPAGVPVATVALNGAKNAGILAAQILGVAHKEIQEGISQYKKSLEAAVLVTSDKLQVTNH